MADQPFVVPTAGQADWDSGLSGDLTSVLEKGYHVTERAGVAVNTGMVLWCNSGGFLFPFNPNSQSIWPHAIAYTAASSGDTLSAIAWGICPRSIGINSTAVPGADLFVSALTPGVVVGSYAGADRKIGVGLFGYGVLFNPAKGFVQERITNSVAFAATTGLIKSFTISPGFYGWNRQLVMIGASADLVECKLYSESSFTTLLYSTVSGGISVVGSFQDRAGFPWDVTAPGSLMYGTLKIMSAAAVGSDTISLQTIWDRSR